MSAYRHLAVGPARVRVPALGHAPVIALAVVLVPVLLFVLVALPTACASRPPVWNEIETSTTSPKQTRQPQPVRAATSVGPRIDRALQEFVSARAQARGWPRVSPLWGALWTEVLSAIDVACADPPRATDLGAFVRARATLEIELDVDERRRVLLPDDLRRRVQRTLLAVDESVVELRLANAPGTLAPSPRLDGDLVLHAPLMPLIVSSPFGVRQDPITGQPRFHAGADFDTPLGSTVYAAASGLVVYAGAQGGYGKQVVIDHGDSIRSHYSHLSEILVDPGQLVDEGQSIALSGSTGRSTGPHLHFAVTNADGEFLDPIGVLDVPFSVIADQVKSSERRRVDTASFRMRLGEGHAIELQPGPTSSK
jgi:murein DD-endopeptidase MepM/ murein hydrolase activator NlpD